MKPTRSSDRKPTLRHWSTPHYLSRVGIVLPIAAVLVALIGLQVPSLRSGTAAAIILLAPAVVALLVAAPRRGLVSRLELMALVIAVTAVIGADLELQRAVFRPEPLATATLSETQPEATLSLPPDQHEVDLEVHGRLVGAHAEGQYAILLERSGRRVPVVGELTHDSGPAARVGRRRMASPGTGHARHETVDMQEVDLAGDGPVHARLDYARGQLAPSLKLLVLSVPRWTHALASVLLAVAGLAIFLHGLLVRRGLKTQLAAGVCWTVAFALYLPLHFDPLSPGASFVRACLIAAVVGAGVGAVLGSLMGRVLRSASDG